MMLIATYNNPINIMDHVASYTLDDAKFSAFEKFIENKIRHYDAEYGPYLLDHLERTAGQLEGFVGHYGYDVTLGQKISRAFRLHDAGKILQDISLWQLTKEKPSDAVKAERKKHCDLGANSIDGWASVWGAPLTPDDERHIELIRYFMKNHHERLDGSGPQGFIASDLDPVLRMATIIDEIDGKLKVGGNTREAMFAQLRTKHAGKFDETLVDAFESYATDHQLFEI